MHKGSVSLQSILPNLQGRSAFLSLLTVTVFLLGRSDLDESTSLKAIMGVINKRSGGAFRDNEQRAISLGYSVSRHKLISFILSTAVTGVAGAIKALVFHCLHCLTYPGHSQVRLR